MTTDAREAARRFIRERQINHPAGCTEPPGAPCEGPCSQCLAGAVVDGLVAEGLLPENGGSERAEVAP